jgi:hypothetical protein
MYSAFSLFTPRTIPLTVAATVHVSLFQYMCLLPIDRHHQHKLEYDVYHLFSRTTDLP